MEKKALTSSEAICTFGLCLNGTSCGSKLVGGRSIVVGTASHLFTGLSATPGLMSKKETSPPTALPFGLEGHDWVATQSTQRRSLP